MVVSDLRTRQHAARTAWTKLWFTYVTGDHTIDEVTVITAFKGSGNTCAVYEKLVS